MAIFYKFKKPWIYIVLGWIVFLAVHAIIVAIRAYTLKRFGDSFYLILELPFILFALFCVWFGSLKLFQQTFQKFWPYIIGSALTFTQILVAVPIWVALSVYVHLLVGGSL
jgi:hypothetical protein